MLPYDKSGINFPLYWKAAFGFDGEIVTFSPFIAVNEQIMTNIMFLFMFSCDGTLAWQKMNVLSHSSPTASSRLMSFMPLRLIICVVVGLPSSLT